MVRFFVLLLEFLELSGSELFLNWVEAILDYFYDEISSHIFSDRLRLVDPHRCPFLRGFSNEF